MNKAKAKERVWQGVSKTELQSLLDNATNLDKPSKVNKQITRREALNIFQEMLNDVPDDYVYGPLFDGRRTTISQALGAVNILREFG